MPPPSLNNPIIGLLVPKPVKHLETWRFWLRATLGKQRNNSEITAGYQRRISDRKATISAQTAISQPLLLDWVLPKVVDPRAKPEDDGYRWIVSMLPIGQPKFGSQPKGADSNCSVRVFYHNDPDLSITK